MTEIEETETVEHPVDNDEEKNLHDEGMGPDEEKDEEETETELEE